MAQKKSFNLLKPVESPKSYWDKVYEWITTRAKTVIVIVEVLIVIAFAVKIFVDNSGYTKENFFSELKSQSAFLEAQYEQGIRRTQRKDIEYKKLWNGSSSTSSILTEIYSYLPTTSREITVRVESDRVQIFGTDDLNALRVLELSMKSSQTFSEVAIDDLNLQQQDVTQNTGQYILTAVIRQESAKRNPL